MLRYTYISYIVISVLDDQVLQLISSTEEPAARGNIAYVLQNLSLFQYFQICVLVQKNNHLPVVHQEREEEEHTGQNVCSSDNPSHLEQ
jgi:hypothetical protein